MSMKNPISAIHAQKGILVGTFSVNTPKDKAEEYLDELKFLAHTAGIETEKVFLQRVERPHAAYFIGKGKLDEIKQYIATHDIDIIIFDDELTPTQQRNIDTYLKKRTIDRTNLILDIFARRAKTSHAKAQVELAQYQYLLPRLTGLWTHLERQKGGIGLRGPGEKELETDRRIVQKIISRLKDKLKKIDKEKAVQRSNRQGFVRVSLVGYTNVGKSTIMQLLSKANVFAENKLFATLDTTVRRVHYDDISYLLSDTVGFIRKLPHSLVESFKSTLDEVREADLLLHVVDISHNSYQEQIDTVNKTLTEIGAFDKPVIYVFNKIDLLENFDEKILQQLEQSWLTSNNKAIFISATKKINTDQLRQKIYDEVKEIQQKRYPHNVKNIEEEINGE